MANPALEAALSACAMARQARSESVAATAEAQANLSTVPVVPIGYGDNGQAIGQLPNGGTISLNPSSNGTPDSILLGNLQTNSAYGNWMPQ